jgi:uncharacterized membrane protein YdjX (TVP38/TMEM64 family)
VTATQFVKRFGLLFIVAALFAGAVTSGEGRWLSPEALQAHHTQLKLLVAQNPLLSGAVFFVAFVLVVTACIPGPGLMAAAAGYLFGPLLGGIISLVACVAGSTVLFLACRSAFADLIARRSGPRVRELEQELARNAFSYLTTLKLVPVVPMFVSTVAAGLAGVRTSALVAATALGSAPICFILASLGAGLGRVVDSGAPLNRHLFGRPEVILPLVGLSLLAAVSIVWRALRRRRS